MNFEFGKIFRDKPLRERAAGQCRPGVWIEHIPVAYLEDIGRVAVAWTFLELALQRIAWTCAGIQERHGLCFTGHAGVRHLQDTPLGLVRRELPQSPPAKSLAVLSKRLGKLRRLRNSIVHGRVYCFADPARSFRQHVRGGAGKTQIETHPVLPNDFDAAVTQIVDATNEILVIYNAVNEMMIRKRRPHPPHWKRIFRPVLHWAGADRTAGR